MPGWRSARTPTQGLLRVGPVTIPTTGVLGRWTDRNGNIRPAPSRGWATIPSGYSLAGARRWHLAFAWLLVVPGLLYWLWSFANRHVQRDLAPTRDELRPRHLWQDIKDHARLRFPTGEAATRYNILQKLSLCRRAVRAAAAAGADRPGHVAGHERGLAVAARSVRRAAVGALDPLHLRMAVIVGFILVHLRDGACWPGRSTRCAR